MKSVYSTLFDKGMLSISHQKMLNLIGSKKTVLEIGSSSGYLTKIIANKNFIDIVEENELDFKKALKYARNGWLGNIEDEKVIKKITENYSIILCADVLEHLNDPWKIIQKLAKKLSKNGQIIVSMPNVACWEMRFKLFFNGDFRYQGSGLLDRTHLRFFNYWTAQDMLRMANLNRVKVLVGEYDFPFRKTFFKWPRLGRFIDRTVGFWIVNKYPNLCVSHMILIAEK